MHYLLDVSLSCFVSYYHLSIIIKDTRNIINWKMRYQIQNILDYMIDITIEMFYNYTPTTQQSSLSNKVEVEKASENDVPSGKVFHTDFTWLKDKDNQSYWTPWYCFINVLKDLKLTIQFIFCILLLQLCHVVKRAAILIKIQLLNSYKQYISPICSR